MIKTIKLHAKLSSDQIQKAIQSEEADVLTGPGIARLTARKMLAWPWLVPRGNPVV